MKKIIFIIIFVFMLLNPIYSEGVLLAALNMGSSTIKLINTTKEEGSKTGILTFSQMKVDVLQLGIEVDKNQYYSDHKINIWKPAFTNLFLGFGLGSLKQNHTFASVIQSTVASYTLGIGLGSVGALLITNFLFGGSFEKDNELVKASLKILLSTAIIIGVNNTFGFFDAIIYGYRYNNTMRRKLEIAVLPNPVEKNLTIFATYPLG